MKKQVVGVILGSVCALVLMALWILGTEMLMEVRQEVIDGPDFDYKSFVVTFLPVVPFLPLAPVALVAGFFVIRFVHRQYEDD